MVTSQTGNITAETIAVTSPTAITTADQIVGISQTATIIVSKGNY